jgi:hypothetical protein
VSSVSKAKCILKNKEQRLNNILEQTAIAKHHSLGNKNKNLMLGIVIHIYNPSTGRQMYENNEFNIFLGYIASLRPS